MMDYSVFTRYQPSVLRAKLSTTFLFNCLVVFVVFLQAPQFTSSDTGPIVFSEGNHNWTHLQSYIGYTNDPWGESASELSHHASALSESNRHNVSYRGKRSVVHLYNIIVCATDCNPLAYKGYGCYCGFLGSGYSMDPIDSCCKMHDWCYTTADCPMFLEYFVPYVWTCYRRRPLCAIGASCGQRLCECDRKLAECLRRFPCPRSKAVCTSSPWRLLQNILML